MQLLHYIASMQGHFALRGGLTHVMTHRDHMTGNNVNAGPTPPIRSGHVFANQHSYKEEIEHDMHNTIQGTE